MKFLTLDSSKGRALFNLDNICMIQKCDTELTSGKISYRIEICYSINQTGICNFDSEGERDFEFEKIEKIIAEGDGV